MARIKRDPLKDLRKEEKRSRRLNTLFNDTLDTISYSSFGSNNNNSSEIERINKDVENIISQELRNTKSITSDDMSTFLVKLFNSNPEYTYGDTLSDKGIRDLDDIFMNDTSGLFQFFQQRYSNKNLLYEDLEMITSQLFELDEAVNTTRDAIITSDNITKTVSRTINFKNMNETDDIPTYLMAIEKLENELKLPAKIKGLITPYALTYGEYYTYIIPYAKLFEQQYKNKMKDNSFQPKKLTESLDDDFIKSIQESMTASNPTSKKKPSFDDVSKLVKEYTDRIEIYNEEPSIPLLEGVDVSGLMDNETFKKVTKKSIKSVSKVSNISTDAVIDSDKVTKMFENQSGCYIKYIDPKKIIPIEILDTVIGYYYIHEVEFDTNKAPFSTTIRVSNAFNTDLNTDIDNGFVSKIAEIVVKSFDKEFLEKNDKFKDLIYNALVYNDLYKKQIKFQFIPKDYIVRFKVNEDEDGNGQSILMKSLFYAKLYLSLLIFKMVTIVTKSNDTKIYYVRHSGLEQNITNKVQEIARSVKGRQINFMDFLNYNSIISKIGANKEIFMPIGRSGEKGIEFDILSGQDVQLNTDLMEMLRTNMINGTGVPSVIMNYINEADYAKTLTMANTKFVGRVISYQMDLNPSLTEFYQKIIRFSNIGIPDEYIDNLIYTFNPPKSLNTNNLNDFISSADSVAATIIKSIIGDNAETTEDINMLKDIMYNEIIRRYLPSIDWAEADEIYKECQIQLQALKAKKVTSPEENQ